MSFTSIIYSRKPIDAEWFDSLTRIAVQGESYSAPILAESIGGLKLDPRFSVQFKERREITEYSRKDEQKSLRLCFSKLESEFGLKHGEMIRMCCQCPPTSAASETESSSSTVLLLMCSESGRFVFAHVLLKPLLEPPKNDVVSSNWVDVWSQWYGDGSNYCKRDTLCTLTTFSGSISEFRSKSRRN